MAVATRLSEKEVGEALASGELNFAGTMLHMEKAADGDLDHISQQFQIAFQHTTPRGRQVLRAFTAALNRIVRNG